MSLWIAFASAREAGSLAAAPRAIELGVGPARAAATIARRLAHGDCSTLLLFGVAGAYREADLAIGDLCVVAGSVFADVGVDCGAEFLDLETLGLADRPVDPYDSEAAGRLADRFAARRVRVATVSSCSGHDARAVALRARHGCELETMESAAVALACADAGVRLVELRSVSNFCGDRAAGDWDLDRAARRIESAVHQVLDAGDLDR